MKRIISLILSVLIISVTVGAFSFTAGAQDADIVDSGAKITGITETGLTAVSISTAAQLKSCLSASGDYEITLTSNITDYVGTPDVNTSANYIPVWCTVGSGVKVLNLGKYHIDMKNTYHTTVSYGSYGNSYCESKSNLCLFSIPSGAKLTVNAEYSIKSGTGYREVEDCGRITYEGVVIKDRDGIDQRDIFYVSGGTLKITDGAYYPVISQKYYRYGTLQNENAQYINVNGTALNVSAGEAVIYGGEFCGTGFSSYDFKRNAAIEIGIRGKVTMYSGQALGRKGANAVGGTGAANLNIVSGGFRTEKYLTSAVNAGYGVEQGESCTNCTTEGTLGLVINNGSDYDYYNFYDFNEDSNTGLNCEDNTNIKSDPNYYKNKQCDYNSTFFIEPKLLSKNGIKSGVKTGYGKPGVLLLNGSVAGTKTNPYKYKNSADPYFDIDNSCLAFKGVDTESTVRNAKRTVTYRAAVHLVDSVNSNPIIGTKTIKNLSYWNTGTWRLRLSEILNDNIQQQLQTGKDYYIDFEYIAETYAGMPVGRKICDHDVYHTTRFYFTLVKDTVTLYFNANGGSGTMRFYSLEEGQEFALPDCGFTAPEGKQFAGWKINGTLYAPNDKIKIYSNTTAYAEWETKDCVLTFLPNGGSGYMSPVTKKYGEYYYFNGCSFTPPSGKRFSHWQSTKTGNEYWNYSTSVKVMGDESFKAIWEYLDNARVTSINLTIDEPVENKTINSAVKNCDEDRVLVGGVAWYDVTDGNTRMQGTNNMFKAGHVYRASINVLKNEVPLDIDSSGKSTVKATINGKEATVVSTGVDSEMIYVEYTFPELGSPAGGSYYVGDVNMDNSVTNKDALILDRKLAKWAGYDDKIPVKTLADLNRDTNITNKDSLILNRYLAKWTGYNEYIILITV